MSPPAIADSYSGVVVKTPTPNIDTATEDPSSEDDEGAEEGSDSDIVDKVGYDFAEEDDDLYINTPVPPYCGRCPAPHQIQPQVKRLVDEGRLVFLDYSLQDRHLGWYVSRSDLVIYNVWSTH